MPINNAAPVHPETLSIVHVRGGGRRFQRQTEEQTVLQVLQRPGDAAARSHFLGFPGDTM